MTPSMEDTNDRIPSTGSLSDNEDTTALLTYSRAKRLRANDRERRRVHSINCAMENLRNAIPGMREKRKSTKLELLRAANHYIWLLDESLKTGIPVDEIMQRVMQPPKYYYVQFPYHHHAPFAMHHPPVVIKREVYEN